MQQQNMQETDTRIMCYSFSMCILRWNKKRDSRICLRRHFLCVMAYTQYFEGHFEGQSSQRERESRVEEKLDDSGVTNGM